jgi:hypothetical protein
LEEVKAEKVTVPHIFKGKQPKFSLGKITNKYLIIDIIHYGIARKDIVMTFYKLSKRFRLLLAENLIYISLLRDGSYAIRKDKDLDYVYKKQIERVKFEID